MSNYFPSDESLIQAVADGDAKAFREFYNQYWNRIYSIAVYYFRSPIAAQDMVQEVFLKIWIQRRYLTEVKNLSAYVNTLTRNMVIDQMRKRLPQSTEITDHDLQKSEGQLPEIERKEIASYIRMAVDQLAPKQKQVYQLAKEQGLSLKEVAERLNISYPTAREYMSIALRNIRAFLREHLQHLYLLALLFILN